jgi:hypothetical protein
MKRIWNDYKVWILIGLAYTGFMDILRLIVIVAIAIINLVILIFLIKNDLSKKESHKRL